MQDQPAPWTSRYRTQVRLAIRITVASLLAFTLSRLAGLSQGYAAVITAVIVMQGSLGASLKAMFDRFVGSLGGAIWGVAMLMAFDRSNPTMLAITLAATVGPLALLVALKPAYRPAPITAIILIFAPASEAVIPLMPAINRMLGIGLGSIVALVVALTVLPARAHASLAEAAGKSLTRMGELAAILMKTPSASGEREGAQELHDEIRKSLAQADVAADGASQERAAYLTGGPDAQPLCRTLRRLYHDLATIGRTTAAPLPEPLQGLLLEPTSVTSAAVSDFFQNIGSALAGAQLAPSLAQVETAIARREAAITELRKAGLTRELTADAVGRMFGFGFSLEQLHRILLDLIDRTNDIAVE